MKDSPVDVFITIKPRRTDGGRAPIRTGSRRRRRVQLADDLHLLRRCRAIQVDQDIIGADDAIGEAELNLKSMYEKVSRRASSRSRSGCGCHAPTPTARACRRAYA